MNDNSPVAPLDRSMLDAANDTLVTAFMDDSMFGWVFPDPAARARGLRRLNRVPLEYGQRYGYVRQSDEGRCVAIWVPPGEPMSPGGWSVAECSACPCGLDCGPWRGSGVRTGSWTRSTNVT